MGGFFLKFPQRRKSRFTPVSVLFCCPAVYVGEYFLLFSVCFLHKFLAVHRDLCAMTVCSPLLLFVWVLSPPLELIRSPPTHSELLSLLLLHRIACISLCFCPLCLQGNIITLSALQAQKRRFLSVSEPLPL